MKKVLSIVLAAMFMLSLVACGGGASTPSGSAPASGSGSTPSAGGSDEGDIVIGGLAPLTGNVAQYGIAAYQGAMLAVQEINDAGGILGGRKINFICEDEKGDATEAVTAYNKLVQNDKIVALVGDITTKPTIAVAQKAVQDGIPMITPTGTGGEITEIGDNIFRACFTDPYQGELMAHYAKTELAASTIAILYDTGDDYSAGIAETVKATAEEIGLEVVAMEGYPTGSVDFNSQLSKIQNAGDVDVIIAPCYYEDASNILSQARKMGITSTFLGPDGWDGVLNQMDESNYDALNNSYYFSQYPLNAPTAELEAFMTKYEETYGEKVNMFGALGYEAMYIMVRAIEAAGSTDSAAIVDALNKIQYQGLVGVVSFANGRDPSRDAYVIEFADGVEVVKGTFAF